MVIKKNSSDEFIQSNSKWIRVLAGPGTGKSYCLKERIKHLVNDFGVNPERILVLSFTSIAAQDLRNDIIKLNLGDIEASTLHSLALKILASEKKKQRLLLDFEKDTMLRDLEPGIGKLLSKQALLKSTQCEDAIANFTEEEMSLESGDNAGTLMRFGKVNYGERAARKMLRDESTKRGDGLRPKKEIAIHTMLSAVIGSLANAPFFKSNAFKQEREWRLIAYLSMLELKKGVRPDKHGNELSPGGSITYDYTIKNDDLVSHLELKSESLHEQISLIRLGPKCKCSVDEVKLFLMSKGWLKHINDESILVRASEASYR